MTVYLDNQIKHAWFEALDEALPATPGGEFNLDALASAYRQAQNAAHQKQSKPDGSSSFSFVQFMTEVLHATLTEHVLMNAAALSCEHEFGRIRPSSKKRRPGELPKSTALSADETIDDYKVITDVYKQALFHIFTINRWNYPEKYAQVINTPLRQAPYIRKTILDDLQYIADTYTDRTVVQAAQSFATFIKTNMGALTYRELLIEGRLLPAHEQSGRQ